MSNSIFSKRGSSNLWLLTEERPKREVISHILELFARDYDCGFFGSELKILPVLDSDNNFTFTYEVIGFNCKKIDNIYIKTTSGYSSFVDFLVFYQDNLPVQTDTPIYAIEETKTDDSESRNTGVFQRCSKFVMLQFYYPNVKKVMLYNLQIEQKKSPTATNIFGSRMLANLGVEIVGKRVESALLKPFSSIDELIQAKATMRKAPKGNVSILLTKFDDRIEISGRLYKSGGLSHDPNIGALSIISAVLQNLGWKKRLVITQHGLSQKNVGVKNKFVQIANILGIELEGLDLPPASISPKYWRYEQQGEKLGTIFIHTVIESFTSGYSIFENHAGCEKGYFMCSDGTPVALAKYQDKVRYKAGETAQIIYIPDLILMDFERSEVINIEGKKYEFRGNGISELKNYDFIETEYISKNYPSCKVIRTVVLYGGTETEIIEVEVGFLLNKNGKLILGIKSPAIFKQAIANLIDYWK